MKEKASNGPVELALNAGSITKGSTLEQQNMNKAMRFRKQKDFKESEYRQKPRLFQRKEVKLPTAAGGSNFQISTMEGARGGQGLGRPRSQQL